MAYIYSMIMWAPVTVIETPSFLRDAGKLMDEDERRDLVSFLAYNPTAGDILRGTGGVRKARWARKDGGKSGGFRVIYFFYSINIPLFALSVFAKNEKTNISQAERNVLRELTAKLVNQYNGAGEKT
jgi:mRNA-degrading endonuclease RelE of RelBE toxin-antitoxin system